MPVTEFYATRVAPRGLKTTMEHGTYKATLHRAPRLEDHGSPHGLPPSLGRVPVYPVDALPGCPDGWTRGNGNYVCPVDVDWGLWFDWTANDHLNTAILPSVKGMNPITGQKLEGFSLEQYKEKCPVHGVAFIGDRLCETCGYKHPPQNYVTHPDTLWWDGFRQPDGKVRQFFFTADEGRDIASLVIGKHNTVPAFGFAFYEPKTPRKYTEVRTNGGFVGLYSLSSTIGNIGSLESAESFCLGDNDQENVACAGLESLGPTRSASRSLKSVSVGAGAEIRQELTTDTLKVDEWKPEPSGIIRLYFVFPNQFNDIVKAGVKDLDGDVAGYLKGLPKG